MTDERPERVDDAWWCDECRCIHQGRIWSFSMEHRMYLHPLFAHINEDRRRAAR